MSELSPEALEYRAKQEAEYSAYVATEAIDIGGVRAFNVGDPVPKGHVERNVVSEDSVAKVNTKAAKTAQANSQTNPVEPAKGENA